MALIHHTATLTPTKLEVMTAWLPEQPWGARPVRPVGAYRFDDPDGEVGLETMLIGTDDGVVQVPLSYRGAPLEGGSLVGTVEHSVLGTRWVYDGCSDPVFVRALVTAVLTGGTEAPLELASGGSREPTTRVRGTGSGPVPDLAVGARTDDARVTSVHAGPVLLTVRRRLTGPVTTDPALLGTWPGQDEPVVLATVV